MEGFWLNYKNKFGYYLLLITNQTVMEYITETGKSGICVQFPCIRKVTKNY